MTANILVVDDLATNLKVMAARLTAEYFNVTTATSGQQALSIASESLPDLILLDVMMPGMDGFECCRRLKADVRTRHIPVVMVTALSQVEDRVRGLEVGADDFLTKPVNDIALLARIRSLIRLKMLADEWRLRQATDREFDLVGAGGESEFQSAAGAKVFVIGGNGMNIEKVRRSLAADNDSVEIATDMDAGLARLGAEDFDLVIVSLLIPDTDGLQICARIRGGAKTRALPILILIGPNDHQRLARALDIGVNDYLMHPIDRNELLARVRTQVRRRRYQDRLRAAMQESLAAAVTDSLTNLYNRRYLIRHLDALIAGAERSGKSVAVLMIDIDHFKAINDAHGHAVGDEVLCLIANRLQQHLRSFDTIARWGGEEFIVAMPDTAADVASAVAERLRARIAATPVTAATGVVELSVTVSIGIAVVAGEGDTVAEVLRKADEALYRAKGKGRNCVALFDDGAAATPVAP